MKRLDDVLRMFIVVCYGFITEINLIYSDWSSQFAFRIHYSDLLGLLRVKPAKTRLINNGMFIGQYIDRNERA